RKRSVCHMNAECAGAFASKPAPTLNLTASTWCANQKQRTNFIQKAHHLATYPTYPTAISYTSRRLASPLL
ncbi:hypothetical protein, partial [Pseudomonas jessenii]|uniref:hypothetical protein n=1 Tax=Pseudomonas jessenii TaxID=77298 RepID=UPI0019D43E9C